MVLYIIGMSVRCVFVKYRTADALTPVLLYTQYNKTASGSIRKLVGLGQSILPVRVGSVLYIARENIPKPEEIVVFLFVLCVPTSFIFLAALNRWVSRCAFEFVLYIVTLLNAL